MLIKKKTLLIITKIDTIKGLVSKLKKKYKIHYFPDATLKQLNTISEKERLKISAIFTNPNRSKIKLDQKVLKMFSIHCSWNPPWFAKDIKYFLSQEIQIDLSE